MPTTAPSPATTHPVSATQAAAPPAELSLEERLTLLDATMTVRLEQAAVAYEVNTAHIPTEPLDLAEVLTIPLTPALQPPTPYPTPVAALLQRAHHQLLTGGCAPAPWSTPKAPIACTARSTPKPAATRISSHAAWKS